MAQQNTNAKSVLIFDEHIEGVSKKGNDYSLIKLSNGLHTVAITHSILTILPLTGFFVTIFL